jgi:hypothetical protein
VSRLPRFALAAALALATAGCRFDSSGLLVSDAPASPGDRGGSELGAADSWPDGSRPDRALDGPRSERSLVDGRPLDARPPDTRSPDTRPPDTRAPDTRAPDTRSPDTAPPSDIDGDGVPDVQDNCLAVPNPGQQDGDGDKLGDLCDPDRDGDLVPNEIDPRPDQKDTVLYYQKPGKVSVDFEGTGSYQPSGDALCHTQVGTAGHDLIRLTSGHVTAKDYQAETQVAVSNINLSFPNWPAAGLAVRVQAVGASAQAYLCIIDLEFKQLVLGRFTPWVGMAASGGNTVPVPGTYRIRATVKGTQLTCEELNSGKKLQLNDSNFTSGPPGFFTLLAQACYDYLWVTAAP